jgi:predicted nucleotidyltransferase
MNKGLKKDRNLEAFLKELRAYFKSRLKRVVVFGSRARGDFSEESDYDCLIIVEKIKPDDEKILNDLETKMLLSNYVLFSTFLFTESGLKKRKYEPFLINAQKEGVIL